MAVLISRRHACDLGKLVHHLRGRNPPEFCRKVLDLLKAGRTVRQVAFDL